MTADGTDLSRRLLLRRRQRDDDADRPGGGEGARRQHGRDERGRPARARRSWRRSGSRCGTRRPARCRPAGRASCWSASSSRTRSSAAPASMIPRLQSKYDVIIMPSGAAFRAGGGGGRGGGGGGGGGGRRTRRHRRRRQPSDPDLRSLCQVTSGTGTGATAEANVRKFVEAGGVVVAAGSAAESIAATLQLPVTDYLVERQPGQPDRRARQRQVLRPRLDRPGRGRHDGAVGARLRGPHRRVLQQQPGLPPAAERGVARHPAGDVVRLAPPRCAAAGRGARTISRAARPRSRRRSARARSFAFGPEITFRAQPHGTFKFLFNAIHSVGGTAPAAGPLRASARSTEKGPDGYAVRPFLLLRWQLPTTKTPNRPTPNPRRSSSPPFWSWSVGSWKLPSSAVRLACCRRRRRRRHRLLREARQHLVAHREVIHRRGDRRGRLLHVLLDDPLVGVEVRVPGVGVVFDRILAQADARQAGRVERRAVGAAGAAAARWRWRPSCRGPRTA